MILTMLYPDLVSCDEYFPRRFCSPIIILMHQFKQTRPRPSEISSFFCLFFFLSVSISDSLGMSSQITSVLSEKEYMFTFQLPRYNDCYFYIPKGISSELQAVQKCTQSPLPIQSATPEVEYIQFLRLNVEENYKLYLGYFITDKWQHEDQLQTILGTWMKGKSSNMRLKTLK